MPSLSTYSAELDYAYAPGMFPAMECLLHRPESCRRVLLHSRSAGTEGAQRLREEAEKHHIRVEEADKALLPDGFFAGAYAGHPLGDGTDNCGAITFFETESETLFSLLPSNWDAAHNGNVVAFRDRGLLERGDELR